MTSDHCRVYWWSHGCDLPRGHAEAYHSCGWADGEEDSRIVYDAEQQVWMKEGETPITPFGDDAPGGWTPDTSRADALLQKEDRARG